MYQFKKMIYIAIVVSIGAQFYLNFFIEGFIITISIILLPLLLYKYQNLNPFLTCIISGIISPLFRMIVMFIRLGNINEAISITLPDVAFYFTYGIVFYYLYTNYPRKDLTRFGLTVFLSDFASNLVEISVRTQVVGLEEKMIKGIFIIALIRCMIVVIIIILLKRYKSFLANQEHEQRYRRLMLLSSSFKSETYFMNKNMKYIEDIMGKIFRAYKLALKYDIPKELRDTILGLSKDVHEIKKDYIRVIKGLEQIFENKFKVEKMSIKDIVNMLEINTKEFLEKEKLEINFNSKVKSNVYVRDHYYFMSVLRNLINNAIEACKDVNSPNISLTVVEEGQNVITYITDNGVGIREDHMDYIFNPGFSTKYNKQTGDINRGIGLTLVRDLVNEHFEGNIKVQSNIGTGTTFIIIINKMNLEGESVEILHS